MVKDVFRAVKDCLGLVIVELETQNGIRRNAAAARIALEWSKNVRRAVKDVRRPVSDMLRVIILQDLDGVGDPEFGSTGS